MTKTKARPNAVKRWRTKHFATQFDAAVKTGVPLNTLQGWEQGRKSSRLHAERLKKKFQDFPG